MVKIATDSCCDLTLDQIKENDIAVLPLLVSLGEDDYFDGVDVQPEDIYEFVKENKQLPKTAARSTEDFKEFFEKLLEDGSEVIYTGIGSGLSCTFENAKRAKEELGWIAERGLDEMCEDTWRWQSSNPDGYEA